MERGEHSLILTRSAWVWSPGNQHSQERFTGEVETTSDRKSLKVCKSPLQYYFIPDLHFWWGKKSDLCYTSAVDDTAVSTLCRSCRAAVIHFSLLIPRGRVVHDGHHPIIMPGNCFQGLSNSHSWVTLRQRQISLWLSQICCSFSSSSRS